MTYPECYKYVIRKAGYVIILWGAMLLASCFPAWAASTPLAAVTAQKGWLNTSRPLTENDLRGRIVLLDFWTYCCINCQHVMPDLKALEEQFGPKLTVIGVHSAKFKNEQDSENIRQAIIRHGLAHPVVNDFDFSVWNALGVHAWPTFLLINPEGNVEKTYSGEGHREELAADIASMIAAYGDRVVSAPLPLSPEKDRQPRAYLHYPGKLAYVPELNGSPALIIADSGNNRLVVARLTGEVVETIGSGTPGNSDGAFAEAQFRGPQGVAWKDGKAYVADTENHLLREVDWKTRRVATLAGTGRQGTRRPVKDAPAVKTALASPWDVAFYPDAAHLAIAMAGTHQLWSYDIAARTVSTLAGNGAESIDDGIWPLNSLSQPSGVSAADGKLYFVDAETSSLRMLEKGRVTTLIGTGLFDFGLKDGPRGTALMQHPLGLFAEVGQVFVADAYNHAIRKYDAAAKTLSTLAGTGERGEKEGAFPQAEFNEPNAVVKAGDTLYVADTNNHRIRTLDLQKRVVSTLPVMPPVTEEIPEFSDILPNAEKLPAQTLRAGEKFALHLALKDGWKINHEAPSYIAIYKDENKHPLAASAGRAALEKLSVPLPALPQGKYRLQGTLFYCEKKAAAQCMIKSVEGALAVGKEGKATLDVPVN